MLATPIGSSAQAGDEISPAAAAAAVFFRNALRLIVIASSPPHSLDPSPKSVQIARQPTKCAERRVRRFHRTLIAPLDHTSIQFPVAARLDGLGKPDQCRFLEMAP